MLARLRLSRLCLARAMSSSASPPPPLTDIGLNLTDDMFQGRYRDKSVHTADHDSVMARARAAGVVQAVLTGDDLDRSRHAVEMARRFGLKCTVGVHPCQVNAFERHPAGADAYMDELSELIRGNIGGKHGDGPVVAVGELGLDYDRLQHADKATQLKCAGSRSLILRRADTSRLSSSWPNASTCPSSSMLGPATPTSTSSGSCARTASSEGSSTRSTAR